MSDLLSKARCWSLRRQHLARPGVGLPEVLRDVIGVYSAHPSAPLSLWARVQSFSEQEFYRLEQERLALRMPAMRQTVYLLPVESARRAFSAALPPASDPYWQKRYSQKNRFMRETDFRKWRALVLRHVHRPLTASELKQATGIPDDSVKLVLNRMAFEGSLLRVGASSLRSNIISYVSASAWTGGSFQREDRAAACAWLAGEYLRAFGPARVKDFQWWAGITDSQAKTAMSACRTVSLEGDYLLPSGDLPDFETCRPLQADTLVILPQWDCYLMGYAPDGRERFISPDLQPKVYGSLGATGGNALGAILRNGLACGSWRFRFNGDQMNVELTMFEVPSGRLRALVTERFKDMAQVLRASSVELLDR